MNPRSNDPDDDEWDDRYVRYESEQKQRSIKIDYTIPIVFAVTLIIQTFALVAWGSAWLTKIDARILTTENFVAGQANLAERLAKIEANADNRKDLNDRRIDNVEKNASDNSSRLTRLETQIESNIRRITRSEDRIDDVVERENDVNRRKANSLRENDDNSQ